MTDITRALDPVVSALDALGVDYSVVGSVASAKHGVARATIDVDVVAALSMKHVEPLVAALQSDYYVDLDAARDAVNRRSMFNAIHLATMLKVDVYVLTDREFDHSSFARRARGTLEPDNPSTYMLDTPEDTILHKLEWYRAGGEVSERQWGDLIGVLRVQGDALDAAYLDRWAVAIGVDDLLARARAEIAGTSGI